MKAATPSTPPPHGVLVLLTQGFPYGHSEPFVAHELPYLARFFERVIVATTAPPTGPLRQLPDNAEVQHLHEQLAWSGLADAALLREGLMAVRRHPACLKIGVKSWLISKCYAAQLTSMLEQSVKTEAPVVLYAYWMSDLAIAAAQASAKRKPGTTIAISRAHGWDLYAERHPFHYLPFRDFLAQHLNRAYPISADGVQILQERGFEQTQLARLGVAPLMHSPPPEQGVPVLVSISSLIPLKRIGLLLDILIRLGDEAPPWIHFGDGPQAEMLRQKAEENGVSVEWAGQVDNHVLRAWLKEHASRALLMNTSQFEGIPVSMMEAMSVGIPCIGPDVGGIAEIIKDRENGYLLRRKAVLEDAVQALRQFLAKSEQERSAMRQAAFQTWNTDYNAERNFRTLGESLQELMC